MSGPGGVSPGSGVQRAGLSGATWLLVQLRPNQGTRAQVNLRRQGYGCFAPRRAVTRRRGTRLVQDLAPLFPGYLFVSVTPGQPWHPINGTLGVARLVMRDGRAPQPVPPAVMDDLMARTDASGVLAAAPVLAPGDRVRIEAGPMSGFVARVEAEIDRAGGARGAGGAGGAVALLLEVMGQAVRAAVPAHALQRLDG